MMPRTMTRWLSRVNRGLQEVRARRGVHALNDANREFHEGYGVARARANVAWPLLVLLGDDLVVLRERSEQRLPYVPGTFHLLKAIAHAPVVLYTLAPRLPGADGHVARLEVDLQRARERLSELLDPVARVHAARVLEASEAFASCLRAGSLDEAGVAAFAARVGPDLLRITDDATDLQLDALDDVVARVVEHMSPGERASFHVVVTGDHQARARSLGCQYFRKILGEVADEECRVVYAENVTTVDEAATLMRTRAIDTQLAGAFFGDPRRLQRDVLGDAAALQLVSFESKVRLPGNARSSSLDSGQAREKQVSSNAARTTSG